MLHIVYAARLERQVRFLCDSLCEGRGCGSAGAQHAVRWMLRQFDRWGLEAPASEGGRVRSTPLPAQRAAGEEASPRYAHSVLGFVRASRPCDEYVLICAHYDNIGTVGEKLYPGADSNASGCVAMMNLAQMFATMKKMGKSIRTNLVFVALDGKESDLCGAKSLLEDLKAGVLTDPDGRSIPLKKIRLMVNIDQLGSDLAPLHKGRPRYLILLGNQTLPKPQQEVAGVVNRFPAMRLDLGYDYYGSERFTRLFYRLGDQGPFVDAGVPAVLFTSGITLRNNKVTDTPDSLDYTLLRTRILFIFFWLYRVL